MSNNELKDLIGDWFPNPEIFIFPDLTEKLEKEKESDENTDALEPIDTSLLEFTEEGSEFLNIEVQPEDMHSLMRKLKNHPKTKFDYLFCLSGIDWGEELGIVYHLESTEHRHIVVVKVKTKDRENPVFDTVCDIWATAEFHEREVFDFFGIKFNNHPNLKCLFLTEDWVGYPLRKDYEDSVNMVIK